MATATCTPSTWAPNLCPAQPVIYGEITNPGTATRNAMDVTTYSPVPLADRTLHVNGQANVAFTPEPVVYNSTFSLSAAVYNPAGQSCANVACHLYQNYVVWGSPYRWWNGAECDLCHRMGLPIPGAAAAGPADKPLATFATQADANHDPAVLQKTACTGCHTAPHKKITRSFHKNIAPPVHHWWRNSILSCDKKW